MEDVGIISLSKGQFARVDAEDLAWLREHRWHVSPNKVGGFYARNSRGLYMHRAITDAPAGMDVDHINHDTLDNRRANLRVCTRKENHANGHWALTTHCPKGHAYDEANTYLNKANKRICKRCAYERSREAFINEPPDQRTARIARQRAYYAANRERMIEQGRAYAATRKADKRAYDAKRRAEACRARNNISP